MRLRLTALIIVSLAGVIPLLVAVGIAGLVFAAALGFGRDATAILPWIAGHALLIVTFGGISALCVQLAGRPVFALLCYLLINFYAYAARQFAVALYSLVAPSVSLASVAGLDWASPLIRLVQLVTTWASTYPFPDPGCGAALVQAFAVYAAVGVVCMAAAGLTFSRRNLERAGDAYVSPTVRTVVSALVSILVGFAAAELCNFRGRSRTAMASPHGWSRCSMAFLPELACVLPVAFSALVFAVTDGASWATASRPCASAFRPLLQQQASPLWRALPAWALPQMLQPDVPNPVDVQRATVSCVSVPFEDEKGVERVTQLHSTLMGSPCSVDEPVPSNIYSEMISYQMEDGTSISRQYAIPLNDDGEPSTGSKAAQALMDFANDPATEEALRSQVDAVLLDGDSSYVTIS